METAKKSSIQRAKSTKAPHIKNEVVARRALGQSKAMIAKALDIAPNTVSSIIGIADFDSMVSSGRLGVAGLIPKSVNVMDQRLDKGSESAAKTILEGIGVLRSKADVNINIAQVSSNSWYQRKHGEVKHIDVLPETVDTPNT